MPFVRPHEEKPSAPEDPHALRPDQKRCRRCKGVVILEQVRCPFCGNTPWLWNPNVRLLIVTIVIALFLLLLMPLVTNRDKPYRVPISDSH